jgi:hypothetical protein
LNVSRRHGGRSGLRDSRHGLCGKAAPSDLLIDLRCSQGEPVFPTVPHRAAIGEKMWINPGRLG